MWKCHPVLIKTSTTAASTCTSLAADVKRKRIGSGNWKCFLVEVAETDEQNPSDPVAMFLINTRQQWESPAIWRRPAPPFAVWTASSGLGARTPPRNLWCWRGDSPGPPTAEETLEEEEESEGWIWKRGSARPKQKHDHRTYIYPAEPESARRGWDTRWPGSWGHSWAPSPAHHGQTPALSTQFT